MDWLRYAVLVLLIVYLIRGLYRAWYNTTDHWHKDQGVSALREDAQITDISKQILWSKFEYYIRTTVCFEDGFRYVSHKCVRKRYGGIEKTDVTDELREEILNDAKEAHKTEIALRDGTLEK